VFSNNFQITGLAAGEARELALLLRSGSLATVIYPIEEARRGPPVSAARQHRHKGSVALRTAIRRLLEEARKKFLLNLAKVGYNRFEWHRSSSSRAIQRLKRGWRVKASQSHAKNSGPADDYETAYRF